MICNFILCILKCIICNHSMSNLLDIEKINTYRILFSLKESSRMKYLGEGVVLDNKLN